MTRSIHLTLSDELQLFVDKHCGAGTPYSTPEAFISGLLEQISVDFEASQFRERLLRGYQDAIDGRVYEYTGDLNAMLDDFETEQRSS